MRLEALEPIATLFVELDHLGEELVHGYFAICESILQIHAAFARTKERFSHLIDSAGRCGIDAHPRIHLDLAGRDDLRELIESFVGDLSSLATREHHVIERLANSGSVHLTIRKIAHRRGKHLDIAGHVLELSRQPVNRLLHDLSALRCCIS